MSRRSRATISALLAAASIHAAPAIAAPPPPGWEAPPPLDPPPAKPAAKAAKPAAPACCGWDSTCCSRQTAIDNASPTRIVRIIELDVSSLPEIVVKESKDGVDGAPQVHAIDGAGRPPPWSGGPKDLVRVVPAGPLGSVAWGKTEWGDIIEPYYADRRLQSLGYGVPHSKDGLTGEVKLVSIDKAGDRVSVDYEHGILSGTPAIKASVWAHVEAAPLHDTWLNAFRGRFPAEFDDPPRDQPPDSAWITFVLPEVGRRFESKDASNVGGTTNSRFSRSWPYTFATFPVGPGRSGLGTYTLNSYEVGRWLFAPKDKIADFIVFAISISQTSAEPVPRARLVLLKL